MVSHIDRLRGSKHPGGVKLRFAARRKYKAFVINRPTPTRARKKAHASKRLRRVKRTWKAVPGLLKHMGNAFFPWYNRSVAMDGKRGGWAGGRAAGCRIDRDLQRVVRHFKSAATRFAAVNDAAAVKRLKLSEKSCNIMNALEEHGLAPVLSQHAIYDPILEIATAIDLVALRGDTPNRVCLIDTKNGYERDALTAYSALMEGPLEDKDDSPQNQFWLQLIVPWVILERHYGVHVYNAYIVRATRNNSVVVTSLLDEAPWAHTRRNVIYNYFAIVRKHGRARALHLYKSTLARAQRAYTKPKKTLLTAAAVAQRL